MRGVESDVVEPDVVLELRVVLLDSLLDSLSSELLDSLSSELRVDERSRPPLLNAVGLDELAEPDSLPESPVGVARTCTRVLVGPHT